MKIDEVLTQSEAGKGSGVLGDTRNVSATRVTGMFRAQDELRPGEVLTLEARGDERILERLEGGVSFDSDIASDSDNTWTDAGVVDAHVHTGWTHDYFSKRQNWTGVDGEAGRIALTDLSFRATHFFARRQGPVWKIVVSSPSCAPMTVDSRSLRTTGARSMKRSLTASEPARSSSSGGWHRSAQGRLPARGRRLWLRPRSLDGVPLLS